MPVINLPQTSISYRRFPQPAKPVLLLSHSLFFDQHMFDPLIEALGDAFDIVAYDHRGQGASSRQGPLNMDSLAQDAANLIEALELAPCYVAGNSMGGFVALRLAARYPQLLAGCVVMGSSADLEHQLAAFEPLVDSLGANGTAPHIDALMHVMFGDATLGDPQAERMLTRWREFMLALGPDIAEAARGVIYRESLLDEIQDLATPLLVLAGEQDHAYSVELSAQIIDVAGRGELQVIAGAGHSVALEKPAEVARALIEFSRRA